MSKKLKIMSLSVEPEMQELLKNSSKKMGCSVSSLVRDLVDKHIDLIVNDGEEIPVMIQNTLKAQGMIPRANGEIEVSDEYKEDSILNSLKQKEAKPLKKKKQDK